MKNRKFRPARTILLSACAIIVLTPVAASAQASGPVQYRIEARDLGAALTELARQSKREIYFSSDLTRGRRAPSISGRLTVEQALDRLLQGSSLTYRINSTGAIAIVSAEGNGAAAEMAASKGEVEPPASEIVVVGSRISRHGDGPAPVVTIDRATIDALGVTNVADVINYLPQQSYSMVEANSFAGARTLSLRGLSVGTTLTLVNGRRTFTSALQGSSGAFDANAIPLSAVDHIEVLAGSASSVYGADAVGGVVNIVLKREIPRPIIDFYHGFADGGDEETRGSAAAGIITSRFRGSLILDYFKRYPLYGSSRDLTNNQDFRRFGSVDARAVTTNPANICSSNGANLPGLSAPCAVVPVGSSGIGLNPSDFLASAGQQNRDSLSRFATLLPETERKSAVATAAFDLTGNLQLFAEGMYATYDAQNDLSPNTISNGLVPANNPYNPFGVPVRVSYLITGLGPRLDTFSENYFRGVGGLKASFGRWSGEASLLYLNDDGTYTQSNRTSPVAVAAALASTDPNLVLNVFQDGAGGSQELLQSLLAAPVINHFASEAIEGTAFLRGPVLDLPAGALDAVFGSEIRKEKILYNNAGIFLNPDRRSAAGFFEFRVPITSPRMKLPLLTELSVSVSGRYDHYSDFGGSFNPQVGITWRPIPSLLFRSSYGRSFRAPSLFQTYQPQTVFQTIAPDPSRNNVLSTFPRTIGGNPTLSPEKATSFSAGAVFTPVFLRNFRAEATYWAIKQNSRVVSPSPSFLLGNPTLFADRIVRAPPSPADIAAGLPGPILSLNATALNSGVLDTDGVDISTSYKFDSSLGEFSPQIAATWVDKYKTADLPGAPVTERVGIASLVGTIPRWRATGSLSWNRGPLGVSTVARYVSPYKDATSLGVLNGRTVKPPVIVDVQASVDFSRLASAGDRLVHGLVLRVGARNLFNARPAFSEIILPSGYDQSQADLRQRFIYFEISQRF